MVTYKDGVECELCRSSKVEDFVSISDDGVIVWAAHTSCAEEVIEKEARHITPIVGILTVVDPEGDWPGVLAVIEMGFDDEVVAFTDLLRQIQDTLMGMQLSGSCLHLEEMYEHNGVVTNALQRFGFGPTGSGSADQIVITEDVDQIQF